MSLQVFENVADVWVCRGRGTDPNPPPPPGTDLHEVSDFAAGPQSDAGFYFLNGVTGMGVNTSLYRLIANSSSHAALVNGMVKGQTDPFRVMKTGSFQSGSPAIGMTVAGFTLQGTTQGHIFGGLDVLYANSPNIHDINVFGMPGSGSGPPGETFSLHFQRTNNPTTSDVVLDGRDTGATGGTPIAATLNGNSYITNGGTWNRVQHLYAQYGFGTAIFQATGSNAYTWNNCTWVGCRKAFNLEDSQCNGPYIFNSPTFGPTPGTGQGEVMQVSSKGFSANVKINDPILTGGLSFPLKVRWYPTETGGTQVATDIQLFIGGVEKTSDPAFLQLVHY